MCESRGRDLVSDGQAVSIKTNNKVYERLFLEKVFGTTY